MRTRFTAADVVVGLVPVLAAFPLRNNDLWWHLASARTMVARHAFLHGDPFSFTGFAASWIDNEWLAQLVFYGAWLLGGNVGLVILRAALYLGIALLLRAYLRAARHPAALVPCLLIGIALSFGWWELRPSVFSIGGTLGLLLVLERARRSGRGLAALPLLFLVWANVHPGFLFGLCVLVATLGAVAVEPLLPAWRRYTMYPLVRPLTLATLASIAATFVNPYGWHVYEQQLAISGNAPYRALLDEWVAPSLPFLLLLLATLVAFAVLRGRRVPLASWVPILGASALATTGVRFEEYFALIAVPALFSHLGPLRASRPRIAFAGALVAASLVVGLASPLAVARHEGRADGIGADRVEARVERRLQRNAPILAAIGVGILLLSRRERRHARSRAGWTVATASLLIAGIVASHGPADAVEPDRYPGRCLEAVNGDGRVFNRLSWGGWLIWTRRQPTFIDGRCAGQPLVFDYVAAYGPNRREVFDAHGIDGAIVSKGDALAESLAHDPSWSLTCEDEVSAVYRRPPAVARLAPASR